MTEKIVGEATENAQTVRSLAGGWIASADVKATALLAVAGAVLAVVLAVPPGNGVAESVLTVLFGVSTIISIVASSLVIFPRTDRLSILRKAGCVDPLDKSPSFFSDLGEFDFPGFLNFISGVDESKKKRDALEQSYVMVVIARRKMQHMRVSVIALVTAMVFLGAAVIAARCTAWHSKPKDASSGAGNVAGTGSAEPQRDAEATTGVLSPAQNPIGTEVEKLTPSGVSADGGASVFDSGTPSVIGSENQKSPPDAG